jgi:hypothetical protein
MAFNDASEPLQRAGTDVRIEADAAPRYLLRGINDGLVFAYTKPRAGDPFMPDSSLNNQSYILEVPPKDPKKSLPRKYRLLRKGMPIDEENVRIVMYSIEGLRNGLGEPDLELALEKPILPESIRTGGMRIAYAEVMGNGNVQVRMDSDAGNSDEFLKEFIDSITSITRK